MRVAAQLGLDDPQTSTLLILAQEQWASWGAVDTRLTVCADPLELREVFTSWSDAQKDDVLQALAQLARPDGGDQIAAAGLLAWLLIPGAARLACHLSHLSHRIDEIVAAQLWIEVRYWNGGPKVAANTLMRARGGVMRDLGIRDDPTWLVTSSWEEKSTEAMADQIPNPPAEQPASALLVEVLQEARQHDLVSQAQCELLLDLARMADGRGVRRAGRGSAGLLAEQVLVDVGQDRGMHRSSVRRHAAGSLGRLREHARSTGFVATA